MSKRFKLVAAMAVLALPLAACSTGSSTSSTSSAAPASSTAAGTAAAGAGAGTIRIDVITHGNAGDSFWDVVKSGAEKAGKDEGVNLHYQSDGDVGKQATLIDAAVAAHDHAVLRVAKRHREDARGLARGQRRLVHRPRAAAVG